LYKDVDKLLNGFKDYGQATTMTKGVGNELEEPPLY